MWGEEFGERLTIQGLYLKIGILEGNLGEKVRVKGLLGMMNLKSRVWGGGVNCKITGRSWGLR